MFRHRMTAALATFEPHISGLCYYEILAEKETLNIARYVELLHRATTR